MTDYLTNIVACLTCGYIGFSENNLILVASSLHPLTSLGIRGYVMDSATGRRRDAPLERRRLLALMTLLVAWIIVFIVLFSHKGIHGLPHADDDQTSWLLGCGLMLLAAGIPGLLKLRYVGRMDGAIRLDAILGTGTSAICALAALLILYLPSIWMFDWFSALIVVILWEGRVLIWSVARIFN